MVMPMQADLFQEQAPAFPDGFRYSPNVVPADMQADLVRLINQMPLKPFDFHGYEGKRRVLSFGWKFDFDTQSLRQTEPIPDDLLPVRDIAARFAGIRPDSLQQVLVTEYEPGAPIGWHRDKAAFARVVGLSLLSTCMFRLRRRDGSKWERFSKPAEPGSAYLLSGPSRSEWEHSIPPVERLRYSITFRELR
jgi:alkylated DNA repair dioxygenase AlkB